MATGASVGRGCVTDPPPPPVAFVVAVMRFLGIPCRVVSNYSSAHDTNANLVIDVLHPDYGVTVGPSRDSIW